MTNPTTDEQAIHAIWELLSVEERPEDLFWCTDDGAIQVNCNCSDDLSDISHRAILDAAREVLDEASYGVVKYQGDWAYTDSGCAWSLDAYPTRTLCTYHALVWLKGKSE